MQIDFDKVPFLPDINVNVICLGQFFCHSDKFLPQFLPFWNWLVHGFRGKPSLAKMMTDAGIYLSFGEKFNAETVAMMPSELLLAETDKSILSITEIIGQLSVAANRDVTSDIITNTATILQR